MVNIIYYFFPLLNRALQPVVSERNIFFLSLQLYLEVFNLLIPSRSSSNHLTFFFQMQYKFLFLFLQLLTCRISFLLIYLVHYFSTPYFSQQGDWLVQVTSGLPHYAGETNSLLSLTFVSFQLTQDNFKKSSNGLQSFLSRKDIRKISTGQVNYNQLQLCSDIFLKDI